MFPPMTLFRYFNAPPKQPEPSSVSMKTHSTENLNIYFETKGEYTTCEVVSFMLGDGTTHTATSRSPEKALGYALRDLAQALIDSGR